MARLRSRRITCSTTFGAADEVSGEGGSGRLHRSPRSRCCALVRPEASFRACNSLLPIYYRGRARLLLGALEKSEPRSVGAARGSWPVTPTTLEYRLNETFPHAPQRGQFRYVRVRVRVPPPPL